MFVAGQTWQFKGWPGVLSDGSPVDIFTKSQFTNNKIQDMGGKFLASSKLLSLSLSLSYHELISWVLAKSPFGQLVMGEEGERVRRIWCWEAFSVSCIYFKIHSVLV